MKAPSSRKATALTPVVPMSRPRMDMAEEFIMGTVPFEVSGDRTGGPRFHALAQAALADTLSRMKTSAKICDAWRFALFLSLPAAGCNEPSTDAKTDPARAPKVEATAPTSPPASSTQP